MKNNTHKKNWFIDVGLFIGFWVASMLDLTGLAVHQWLGLGVTILAGYHLVKHWTWVKSVTSRLFGGTSDQARRFYLIDTGLMIGFSMILLTGLVISTWFDLSLANDAAWRNIHVTVTILTMILIVLKIGAHWRWVVREGQRILSLAPRSSAKLPNQVGRPQTSRLARREFLTLMGIVSVAALIPVHSALVNRASSDIDAAGVQAEKQDLLATQLSSASVAGSENTASSSCVVRCPRGCSFPGRCRRYVDTNQNERCDLGECA
jgi:hypothetical protein